MILLIDSLEQEKLEFPKVLGITVATTRLEVGDYTAMHGEVRDSSVVERKSLADLFTSFAGNYEAEKDKLLKAKGMGLTYILAIEVPFLEVLKGNTYWKDGELHESKKSGLSQIRQLMTWQRKYGVVVWFCQSRREMAMQIQEYFLAQERVREEA